MTDDTTKNLVIDLCVALENLLYPELKDKRINPKIVNQRALKWIEENCMEDKHRAMVVDLSAINKALEILGWVRNDSSLGIEYNKGVARLTMGYWQT